MQTSYMNYISSEYMNYNSSNYSNHYSSDVSSGVPKFEDKKKGHKQEVKKISYEIKRM